MRVVEVIIDGFKSYAVRTVISGWDVRIFACVWGSWVVVDFEQDSFNSITGLNGSG